MKAMFGLFGRPDFLRAFHGWCTLLWLPITLVAYLAGWLESVIFVSVISMVALFLGSFSAWQASRTEVAQDKMIKEVKKNA